MREWNLTRVPESDTGQALDSLIMRLGLPHFDEDLLGGLYPLFLGRCTGPHCRLAIYMLASHGIPDTTHDCGRAYPSGPHRGRTGIHRARAGR
ncbi:MAG: hypothetical protein Q8L91_09695 [Polaromonas sp.]|nr:hypothetical protein [Polaromonas sp.]